MSTRVSLDPIATETDLDALGAAVGEAFAFPADGARSGVLGVAMFQAARGRGAHWMTHRQRSCL